jgi:hypothetical protein
VGFLNFQVIPTKKGWANFKSFAKSCDINELPDTFVNRQNTINTNLIFICLKIFSLCYVNSFIFAGFVHKNIFKPVRADLLIEDI